MKYKVTKLKRYKIFVWIINILFLPIVLPSLILVFIGEKVEAILNIVDDIEQKIIYKISDILKFEEVANKQYEINRAKFKQK